LAVGTVNGSIIFYWNNEDKQIHTVGKHSSPVTTLLWSKDNILLSYSDEKKITISQENSETHSCIKEQGKYLVTDCYNP